MRAVDTHVLARLVTRDDAKQVAAAGAFVEKGAWVSHLALAEATWVLAAVYELGATAIATAVEMLLNHEDLTLEASEVVSSALETFRRRPALGFSDCLMLEVARNAGQPATRSLRPQPRQAGRRRKALTGQA
jgi:predicted nucleic-acid-binding protein